MKYIYPDGEARITFPKYPLWSLLDILGHEPKEWLRGKGIQEEYRGVYSVTIRELQELFVPKQEITQEQVQKYLSEHGIEIVEKPVIPQ